MHLLDFLFHSPDNGHLMALIEIHRRCTDCETTRAQLRALQDVHEATQRKIDNFQLDYTNLYDKVRTNLSKLAKRAEKLEQPPDEPQNGDDLDRYRRLLVEHKLGKG